LLTDEFQFIDDKVKEELSWKEIATDFNKEYKQGITPEAIRKRYQREVVKLETLGDDSVEKAFRLIKQNPQKPTDLAKRFNLDMDGLEDLMDDLMNSRAAIKFHQGYLIFDKTAPTPDFFNHQIELFKGEGWYKYGLVSDQHICSAHEQIDLLYNFYRICEEEKVECMLAAGDFTSGNGTVYRGQMQDLKIVGEDKQIDYVVGVYPQTSLRTYTISGNHDLDLYKQCGSDIMQKICEKREDITYLGKMNATVEHEGISFRLVHGEGGLGLIRSYKPQRIIDAERADEIADVTIVGHWHVNLHMPGYRNSVVILPGCFEAKSDYLIKKSLEPDIGGVILEVKIAEVNGIKKIVRHKVEFLDFGTIMRN
jgi:predicted phosphodiesterase